MTEQGPVTRAEIAEARAEAAEAKYEGQTQNYIEENNRRAAAEARVKELEEDLRDERNDCIQDQAYIGKLKARVEELEEALRFYEPGEVARAALNPEADDCPTCGSDEQEPWIKPCPDPFHSNPEADDE